MKSVGIFVENEYQELEFWYPYLRLQEEGIKPVIIAPEKKTYKSKLGYGVEPDCTASEAEDKEFDAIIIPGGYAPDKMRTHQAMLNIVKSTYEKNNIVAAICHAAWVLISAGVISGKKATCFHTVKDDVKNAGGHYLDETVVVDGNIITSRQPSDLPAFCKKIIEKLKS
ncbi:MULTISPECIES: type 1 glutamine amidotransferase domain-containing protein [Legionella]|uniref:Type 1 glutamine amidotransferase n=1 Tax=Legionella septentrionalis TaxID=2498109 RepID=A0A3S0WRE0_9GAMM|nr:MULTISPECIES: type 1 glutamine amidotransferase domain-containing protein [Legionella]MCP0913310.1 type 1 glutamine amidotransferase [Legionella sp. 27cVA30]RUQ85190.1 type 1 glutamine amidotransferase [Legionella septentrionalis]RUQ97988.1 type 1 glutamine amidotransferase [Legionella septentrionalis]RUR09038.1 type 1 glutamine amidotransferase [Legionella septentrionalis]RUR14668.1 type 1 glutamine amidotransferase [Legionella septentrionalis]